MRLFLGLNVTAEFTGLEFTSRTEKKQLTSNEGVYCKTTCLAFEKKAEMKAEISQLMFVVGSTQPKTRATKGVLWHFLGTFFFFTYGTPQLRNRLIVHTFCSFLWQNWYYFLISFHGFFVAQLHLLNMPRKKVQLCYFLRNKSPIMLLYVLEKKTSTYTQIITSIMDVNKPSEEPPNIVGTPVCVRHYLCTPLRWGCSSA